MKAHGISEYSMSLHIVMSNWVVKTTTHPLDYHISSFSSSGPSSG